MNKTNGYSFAGGRQDKAKTNNLLKLLGIGLWLFVFNVLIWVFGLLITSSLVTWCAVSVIAIIDALFNCFAIQYCKKNWHKLEFKKTNGHKRNSSDSFPFNNKFESFSSSSKYSGSRGNLLTRNR